MPVVAIGVNHHTAPLSVLEAMTIGSGDLGKALHALCSTENVSEAVVLSTCNRTEVYAVAEKFHGGYADVRSVLAELSYLDLEDFTDHLDVRHDGAAAAHLFDVVTGLDSVVLGEHEIQGQVKAAWEAAQAEGTVGPALNLLFRHAVEAGKRARTETGIGQGTASVSFAGVALAAQELERRAGHGLAGTKAIVLGAGDMGASMAASLRDLGVDDLVVVNRTFDTAREVAAVHAGRAVRFADLVDEVATADVLVSSTGASTVLLTVDEVASVLDRRGRKPLVIVDIAMPRDVDPAIDQLDGVTVLDMDDIGSFAAAGVADRQREIATVRALLDEELERYHAATSAREIAPAIVALRDAAEAVRQGELARSSGRLGELDEQQQAAIDALTQGLVAKLLHHPTAALRDAAGTPKGERLVQALRDLFGIDT